MANMSIEELIEEIEVYVDNCKTAGVLSSGSMIKINREELLAMLDEVRTRLPKELAESRQIIKSKESIIADAKARAERIVKDAAKEAGVMIDDNEIVALANMRADSIVKDAQKAADELNGKARETAREVQTGALQYTQNMLEGLEYMYSTIIKEEKEYFNSVLEKLKSEHKQHRASLLLGAVDQPGRHDDLQLGAGIRTGRRKEDFEKKEERAEE